MSGDHLAQVLLMPGLTICPGHCGGSLAARRVPVPPAVGITNSSVWGCMYIPSQTQGDGLQPVAELSRFV